MKPNAWLGFFILASIVFWGLLIGFVGSMQKDIAALQKENAELKKEAKQLNEAVQYIFTDQLIRFADPKEVNRSIKVAPLPKLITKMDVEV